jgi:hypothetical protein
MHFTKAVDMDAKVRMSAKVNWFLVKNILTRSSEYMVKKAMPGVSQQVWLPCSTGKGMFSSEYAVEIKLGENSFSLFADTSLIKKEQGENYLLVTLIGDNGEPDHKTILLPSECFETGSRWLSIPQKLLKAA